MSANGDTISVGIDLDGELPTHYLGSDEDGPHYGPMTMRTAIIERAAEKLVAPERLELAKLVRIKADEAIDAEIATRLPELVEQALSTPTVVTDDFGRERTEGTVRDALVAYMGRELTQQKRGGYNSYDRTALGEVLTKYVSDLLGKELSAELHKAREQVREAIRNGVAKRLGEDAGKAIAF